MLFHPFVTNFAVVVEVRSQLTQPVGHFPNGFGEHFHLLPYSRSPVSFLLGFCLAYPRGCKWPCFLSIQGNT